MAIFKLSMKDLLSSTPTEKALSREHPLPSTLPAHVPEKDIHVVDLKHEKTENSVPENRIEFEKTTIDFETNDPLQTLIIDIKIFNEDALSNKFKFAGISCQDGEELMIYSCQCILLNDERVDIELNEKYDLEKPAHVIVKFRMPKKKDYFKFFLDVFDLTDPQKKTVRNIDPGVGNGPPQPKTSNPG